jgi:hypothetical protein
MTITLVTTYHDLSQLEDRPHDRTRADYLHWGDFVLRLDVPIVFFVSEDTYSYIVQQRKAYGLWGKTRVVRRQYQDLPWAGRTADIQKCLDDNPVYCGNAFRNGAAFYTLTWSKFYLLEEVIHANPFATEYFGWIDFGILRVVEDYLPETLDERFFTPPSKKIHVMELEWTSERELQDLKRYSSEIRFKIPAGFWTGHATYFEKLIPLFKDTLVRLLSQRIIMLEEVILSILVTRHPELFKTSYGNYYHLLINYKKTRVVCDWMFHNIDHCIGHECWGHVHEVCSRLYDEAYCLMTPEQRFLLFDRWSYSSYYHDRRQSEACVALWLDKLAMEPEQLQFVKQHEDRILKNLSYYDRATELRNRLLALISGELNVRT